MCNCQRDSYSTSFQHPETNEVLHDPSLSPGTSLPYQACTPTLGAFDESSIKPSNSSSSFPHTHSGAGLILAQLVAANGLSLETEICGIFENRRLAAKYEFYHREASRNLLLLAVPQRGVSYHVYRALNGPRYRRQAPDSSVHGGNATALPPQN